MNIILYMKRKLKFMNNISMKKIKKLFKKRINNNFIFNFIFIYLLTNKRKIK